MPTTFFWSLAHGRSMPSNFTAADETLVKQLCQLYLSESMSKRERKFSVGKSGGKSKMIKGVLIINNHGKPRLVKFYQSVTGEDQQQS
eukprot:gene18219-13089_t